MIGEMKSVHSFDKDLVFLSCYNRGNKAYGEKANRRYAA